MKANLQAAVFEERFRTTIAPRLMSGHWLRYQVKRSRIAYLPAYRRCANRKAPLRCLVEATLLTLRWRCLPFHYLRYGLYRTGYSLGAVFSYLPETVFYYRLLSKLNRDILLLDDKLVCKRILGDAGLPQARLLLSLDPPHDDPGTCPIRNGRGPFYRSAARSRMALSVPTGARGTFWWTGGGSRR